MEDGETIDETNKAGQANADSGAPVSRGSLASKGAVHSKGVHLGRASEPWWTASSLKLRLQTRRCKKVILAALVILLLLVSLTFILIAVAGKAMSPIISEEEVDEITSQGEYEEFLPEDFACPSGEFQCGNMTNCVAQKFQCNGENDCGNNADEIECEHDEGWVKHFDKKVQAPVNPRRRISQECALTGYPDMCKCYERTRLQCVDANLTKVPQEISSNLTYLNLDGNLLQHLQDGAFERYPELVYLNLMRNDIEELPVDIFRGLTDVDKLYLTGNQLAGFTPGTFKQMGKLAWLVMNENKIEVLEEGMFQGLDSVYWLMLQDNRIRDFKQGVAFRDVQELSWIDFSGNPLDHLSPKNFSLAGNISIEMLLMKHCNITKIHRDTFQSFKELASLVMPNNMIKDFPSGLFRGLSKLRDLNIGFSPATKLPEDLFDDLDLLDVLDLEGMIIENISARMFQRLPKLQHIEFSKFGYCSYAPHVRTCKPRSDGISSIENLLKDVILRVSVWTIALLCFVGNAGVLVSRFLMKAENRIHSLVVINLCTADFCMSIYLFIIGYHDNRFRNSYNTHALDWMQSATCKFAGFLAMFSSEVSVFMLTFISLERFICIVYPYRLHRLTSKEATVVMSFIWFLGAMVAWVPLTSSGYFVNFYGSNGVCFPLHIHDPWLNGWEYSSFIFLGLNASCFAAIAVSYTGMFISIQQTRKAATHIGRRGDLNYAKRFFFVVLTDALCWLPIAILKILSLCGYEIPATLYGWIVIFVLPINSALNPILYTLSTTSFTQWFHKHIKRRQGKSGSGSLGSKNEFSLMRGRIGSSTEPPTEYSSVHKQSYDSNSSPVVENRECSTV